MAHDDKSGEIIKVYDKDNLYMSDFMHFINSLARKTSTYKYAFFKSILDNIFNVNDKLELSFKDLSYSFSKMYWNLISKYKLPQYNNTKDRLSLIEKEINEIINSNSLIDGVDFDSLEEAIRNRYLNNTKGIISIYVVGALYSDLNSTFYGFDKSKKIIWFNESSYNFLIKYKSALEKLNYYAWIIWMENILSISEREEGNIAIKLDESTKRESLEAFKNDLYSSGDKLECFYCEKEISLKKCHMDHFIPWSFVKDDKIWNLVFSCSSCNEAKSNKIPSELFLDKIIYRNKNILLNGYEDKLRKLYKSAIYNGFNMWDR